MSTRNKIAILFLVIALALTATCFVGVLLAIEPLAVVALILTALVLSENPTRKKTRRVREPMCMNKKTKIVVAKFLIAFIIAVTLAHAVHSNARVFGTYSPETDTIWVKENLDNATLQVVTAHEQLHQDFYHALPFYKYFPFAGGDTTATLIITLFLFGLMLPNRKVLVGASIWLLIVAVPEIHAYGVTLFRFGFSGLTSNFFNYLIPPLIMIFAGLGLIRVVEKMRKKKKPKTYDKIVRFRGKEKRTVNIYTLVLYISLVVAGACIAVYLMSNSTYGAVVAMVALFASAIVANKAQKKLDKLDMIFAKGIKKKEGKK